ncbi:sensor histidine kinase [Paenibacillus thalictri]|uniref:Two-component sensor histidine kinase n=1 Tax=Paenibacillus thalictri TaxID=2527873 RepID=A0A4V2J4H7_9BACL|nr:histidine kinase [Paenibacillus thalictri]TBL79902.1 two-component sensor histidine kinase [Paenibacillus thalictri]
MRYLSRIPFKSIRVKLVIGFLVIIVPLIGLLIYNNYYAIKVVRNQVAHSYKSLVTLYMDQIDRNLEEVDKYLYNLAALESDLLSLELSENDNYDQYFFAKIRLANKLETDMNNYKSIDMFFFYSAVNDEFVSTRIPGETYDQRRSIQDGIVRLLRDTPDMHFDDNWFVYKLNGDYYLCHIMKTGNVYIGGWVRPSKLMIPLNLIELGQAGKSVLVTDQAEPMDKLDILNPTEKTNEYLHVSEKSRKGDFSLLVLVPDSTILERLPDLQRVTTLIIIGAFLVLPAFYTFLRKVILLPINRIVVVMRRIRDGYLEDRITQYPTSYEFELMNDTFNNMVAQIRQLKISVYEEQLTSQKAELKHLQLQINPHFFLNSLNIIYSLAQLKNFELIQEMSLSLVQYIRFMFQSNLKFVTLKDEYAHTRNYLRIQAMRFPQNFTFELNAAEPLLDVLVPPLMIQTFVENTIKHAVSMEEQIELKVDMQLMETDPETVRIVISDTGEGFPEHVLQALQRENGMLGESGEHIGIWNARHRLRLLYQDKAKLLISNGPAGGATVEIQLPLCYEESEQGENAPCIDY